MSPPWDQSGFGFGNIGGVAAAAAGKLRTEALVMSEDRTAGPIDNSTRVKVQLTIGPGSHETSTLLCGLVWLSKVPS